MSGEDDQVTGTGEDDQVTGTGEGDQVTGTGENPWQRQMKAALEELRGQMLELGQARQELADQISELVQSRPADLSDQIETLQKLQEAHTARMDQLQQQVLREERTLAKSRKGEEGSPVAKTDPPPPKPSRWL